MTGYDSAAAASAMIHWRCSGVPPLSTKSLHVSKIIDAPLRH